MNRRRFLKQSAVFSSACLGLPALGESQEHSFRRIDALIDKRAALPFPQDKRVPLGLATFSVPAGEGSAPVLQFDDLISQKPESCWLRLIAAIDFREEKAVRAYLPQSKTELGVFEMIYAHPFQPFEIPVSRKHLKAIVREGIALQQIKGESPAWFFAEEAGARQGMNACLLLSRADNGDLAAFRENLYSMNSFAPFGWIGGCVLDALWERHQAGDPSASTTLQEQLGHFLSEEEGVIFENPHTRPIDGNFNSIEDFLPFVPIAGMYPGHYTIQQALSYLQSDRYEAGMIYHGQITTEGCYTVAYPLAFIAGQRKDRKLAQLAMDNLNGRRKVLEEEGHVYQRGSKDGRRSYRNWGRGVAWYLLGISKTLKVLQAQQMHGLAGEQEIITSFQRVVKKMAEQQDKTGMWNAYLDRPKTMPDTSGTAGIATAIAHGCDSGLVPADLLNHSKLAWKGLKEYLTPDGHLQGMTQINRGGEDLQSGGYRVISQFGLGLMAQLETALT